jgi:hypothetical protein
MPQVSYLELTAASGAPEAIAEALVLLASVRAHAEHHPECVGIELLQNTTAPSVVLLVLHWRGGAGTLALPDTPLKLRVWVFDRLDNGRNGAAYP